MKRGFAIGNESGPEWFLEGGTLGEAVRATSRGCPGAAVYYDGDLETSASEKPDVKPNESPETMPARAFKATGLPVVSIYRVMSLDPKQAHRKLAPIFVDLRGKPIGRYQTPVGMREMFLTANAKLVKSAKMSGKDVKPSFCRGMNLMPHTMAKKLSEYALPMKGQGLCLGSSAACRSTCLVYSGNNPLGDRQSPGKLRRTEALYLEPEAWVRMFLWAVEEHVAWCRDSSRREPSEIREFGAGKFIPYVRPNLLSDIPWELVCPGLIGASPRGTRFYDYTKVAGRDLMPDYDLTFSFSGANEKLCEYELARGRRVAVVFWLPKGAVVEDIGTFMGRRVVPGDEHDFRDLDASGVIVGLKYKVVEHVVEGKRVKFTQSPPRSANKIVVPAFCDDHGRVVVAQVPSQTPGGAEVFADAGPTRVA